MKKFVKVGSLLIFGCFLSANASAAVISCFDVAGNTGSGGKNASSSITSYSGSVSSSNCGPFRGNDSLDLTSALGGYGYDLTADGGLDGGWFQLDKADGADGSIITGTGWGTTSGTFSFTDSVGYDSYLIALKFDGVYSTYLSDTTAQDWMWDTDTDEDGGFAISHLSVYVRNSGTTPPPPPPTTSVPEPAPLALLGLGLVSMGIARRKRLKVEK